jgi:hypothetical protein
MPRCALRNLPLCNAFPPAHTISARATTSCQMAARIRIPRSPGVSLSPPVNSSSASGFPIPIRPCAHTWTDSQRRRPPIPSPGQKGSPAPCGPYFISRHSAWYHSIDNRKQLIVREDLYQGTTSKVAENPSCNEFCIRARVYSCRKSLRMCWALAPANADDLKKSVFPQPLQSCRKRSKRVAL